jgi:hypothetical protein
MEMPSQQTAILAHSLGPFSTGEDLFRGLWVRVRGTVIAFSQNGLNAFNWYGDDDFGLNDVACAASPALSELQCLIVDTWILGFWALVPPVSSATTTGGVMKMLGRRRPRRYQWCRTRSGNAP